MAWQTRVPTGPVAAVVGVGALLALTTWASAAGPGRLFGSPGPPRTIGSGSHGTVGRSGLGALSRLQREHREHPVPTPGWARWAAGLLELLVLLAVAYVLWRLARSVVRWVRERPRPRRRDHEQVDLGVLSGGPALVEALVADAATQEAELDQGAPRNAIVACWHRFEATAERAGVRRRSWQTPSEFVLEVLDGAGADAGAVARLADLYREARFSDHPLTEAHRASALEALRATHGSLGAVVLGAGESGPA